MGNGKDNMIISTAWDQLSFSRGYPLLLHGSLTAWAVPVVTGAGMDLNRAALGTVADVIAKFSGFAVHDAFRSGILFRSNSMRLQIRRTKLLESVLYGIV